MAVSFRLFGAAWRRRRRTFLLHCLPLPSLHTPVNGCLATQRVVEKFGRRRRRNVPRDDNADDKGRTGRSAD